MAKIPFITFFFHWSKKKVFLLLTVAVLVLAGFFLLSPKKQEAVVPIPVRQGDIKQTLSASGSLVGKETANLKFKSSGRLAFLPFKIGDEVKKGQTIASLDTQDLAITLQQANNTLRSKQATVEKAHDDVKDHDSDETFTQKEVRTKAEVDKDNAFDSVKAAQRAFQDALIYAPFSGIVTQSSVSVGQFVSGTDLIAQLVDPTELFFDADFDEADAGKINVGQMAEITLDAYPDKVFAATVDKIIPQVKTTSSGATVVTIKLKLTEPVAKFIAGLNGQAEVVLKEVKNTLIIPQDSILGEDEVAVETFKNGRKTYVVKKIKTGVKSDTDIEVIEGLEKDEKIVKNPQSIKSDQLNLKRPG